MRDPSARQKTAIIVCLLAALTVLNYGIHLRPDFEYFKHFETTLQRLYFLPIILGSFWFALRGGMIVFLVSATSLIPYLIIHWDGLSAADLNRILLVMAYFLMAFVLGKAVLTQRKEQERAREAETLAAIGRSMSAVAHDMKTPIIAIGGFARMVRKTMPDKCPEAEKLDIVLSEAGRLERLLKSVLDFGRPFEVNRAEAQIDRVVKECLAVTEHVSEQYGITLETRIPSDMPPVYIDEMRVKQVLINLITNAIQASPQGQSVSVGCSVNGKNLILEIADCGCGIPKENREEVFSPFFTTKKEGVGLGLPIARKIVEAHGGNLRILDKPGGGLIFRIEISGCMRRAAVQCAVPGPVTDEPARPGGQPALGGRPIAPDRAMPYSQRQERL